MVHSLKILAPAGDDEMLRAAVFSGADCVYLGVRGFNARRGAQNFDGGTLAEAVAFCHGRGCEVYAAINTLVLPGREAAMTQAVRATYEAGCDAVIVQDLATAAAVRTLAPGLALHASTQMSVHSPAGVEKLAELGFSRAILARELTAEEIAHIARHSPIELEVFVHGALCVSVSGQCYASAFLGGRSANRGGCAGPCRLCFRAHCAEGRLREAEQPESGASRMVSWPGKDGPAPAGAKGTLPVGEPVLPAADSFHLSLKDLSILDALPELERMGIAAAKIEGRLRGPEYCAVAVDCAHKALDGLPYDRRLLQEIFSRSGFTGGWYTGAAVGERAAQSAPGGRTEAPGAKKSKHTPDTGCFGARTEADSAATRAALPKARALYRRERPRVPVEMVLRYGPAGGELTVTDGACTVHRAFSGPLAIAEKDPSPALAATLAKTGGTPFYIPENRPIPIETGGAFLPTGMAAGLRREALEELLALRQRPDDHRRLSAPVAISWGLVGGKGPNDLVQRTRSIRAETGKPLLWARFEQVTQIPGNAANLCAALVLPLEEAARVPSEWRRKTWLWLPRVLFGAAEIRAARQVAQAREMGFAGFEAGNLSHLKLCAGLPVIGGFGLNLTNPGALAQAAGMGCRAATLSPELSLAQLRSLAAAPELEGKVLTGALAYGHLPVMLTRACPLAQAEGHRGCAGCPKTGLLADRTGRAFPVLCRDGARSVYNPISLWMADRLEELPVDYALLYFTFEDSARAGRILGDFAAGRAAAGEFTRGLYDHGTED